MSKFFRAHRRATAFIAAAALALTGGALLAPSANADGDGPAITLTATAVDAVTGAPLTQLVPGVQFMYEISIGCPGGQCGTVDLTDVLPANIEIIPNGQGAINPPLGGAVTITPAGAPWTDKTVSVHWDSFTTATVFRLPAKLSDSVSYDLNGQTRTNTATVTATDATGTTELTGSSSATLNIGQIPGLKNTVTKTWSKDGGGTSVQSGSGALTHAVITAIANANTLSDLTIADPGSASSTAGKIDAYDAFDLVGLSLNQNPNGATVTFTLVGGAKQSVDLPAGTLTTTPPADVIGYSLVVKGLPGLWDSTDAQRTIKATGDFKLRDMLRSDPSTPVVTPGAGAVTARNPADATDTVAAPAPGQPAFVTSSTFADIGINEISPTIAQSKTWVTASGDAKSVYGSGEGSTATITAANTGVPTLHSLTMTEPSATSGATAFLFEKLTGAPALKFPAGATRATITYRYLSGVGATQDISSPTGTVPGTTVDGRSFDDVSGVEVTFYGETGREIAGNCALADAACNASMTLNMELRNNRLDTGAAISLPANGASTSVTNAAGVSALASVGSNISNNTPVVSLSITPPQYLATAGKAMGDGTDSVAYPLTGTAKAGDRFDSGAASQNYAEHRFVLTGGTKPVEGSNEGIGAGSLTITDPQTTPTIAKLNEDPFDLMKFTQLPNGQAVCETAEGDPGTGQSVASSTTTYVWVVNSVTSPTSISKVPLTASIDLATVVGVEYVVTPDGASRFPDSVRCATPAAKVQWRDFRVSNSTVAVTPSLGNAAYPGLLNLGNTIQVSTDDAARITSGTNNFKTTASDQLYLVDIPKSVGYKGYSSAPYDHNASARPNGIAGQGQQTAFYIAGMPSGLNAVASKLTDGYIASEAGSSDNSFDIFALTGIRETRVGPDQTLTITLLDKDGNPVGPTGTVTGPTTGMSAADIEDSQSAAYQTTFNVKRPVVWNGTAPTAAELATVMRVDSVLTRTSDATTPLQVFGAFGFVVDVSLRTNHLVDGTKIEGSMDGVNKLNYASVYSSEDGTTWNKIITSSAIFKVYGVEHLFGDATITWDGLSTAPDLVAHDSTSSIFTLRPANQTAIGSTNPAATPATQWTYSDSTPVGADMISASVGGPAGQNPFALVDFTAITGITWPLAINAASPATASDYIAGTLTYTYANGTTQDVAAPYQAYPSAAYWASLAPSDPANVVGVSISFHTDGRLIGIRKNASTTQSELKFSTTLRNTARAGYDFTFTSGDPASITAGAPIDGPNRTSPQQPQTATAFVSFRATSAALPTPEFVLENTASDPINLQPQTGGVSISKIHNYPGGTQNTLIYRDWLATTSWTVTAQNSGNSAVDSIRIADPAAALDEDTWPLTDPVGYSIEPDTMYDSFDLTGVSVTLPAAIPSGGTLQADLYVRDSAGVWHGPASVTRVGSGTLAFPVVDGVAFKDVTGTRLAVKGLNGARIDKGSTAGRVSVTYGTQLREFLRSDSATRAPANSLVEPATQWTVTNSANAATYLNQSSTAWARTVAPAVASANIAAGSPLPLAVKQVGAYSATNNSANKNFMGNPGEFAPFFLVLENSSGATSNLYNLKISDAIPVQMSYSPTSSVNDWSIQSAPAGFTQLPTATTVTDPVTHKATQIDWTWPSDYVLKPGERVVIRLPLRMEDGASSGVNAVNSMRVQADGITGATAPSRCAAADSANASCVSVASLGSLDTDSTRIEKYIAETGHGATLKTDSDGDGALDTCDPSSQAPWSDGTWWLAPCVVDTTKGETITYRLKVINSGNKALSDVRVVDQLPTIGDSGTVLPTLRGTQWTPTLVPGSLTLLSGTQASDLGARGDGVATNRFANDAAPCKLLPDAYGGQGTLDCTSKGTSWSGTDSTSSESLGTDIHFATPLAGGEYVIVEYKMTVPATGTTPVLAANSAAATGRTSATSSWLPASESALATARTGDTSLTLTKALTDDAVTPWHLLNETFTVGYSCQPTQSGTDPITGTVTIGGPSSAATTSSQTVTDLPVGSVCQITSENYVPSGYTYTGTDSRYGAAPATGYSYLAGAPVTLSSDATANNLTVTNTFAATSLTLGKTVAGNASSLVDPTRTYDFSATCSFSGKTVNYGPYSLANGQTQVISDLPVGADCNVTETGDGGASSTSATLDSADISVTNHVVNVANISSGATHALNVTNTFAAGSSIEVVKNLVRPTGTTGVGDFEFTTQCTLDGAPVSLPAGVSNPTRLVFGPAETSKSFTINGLPVGTTCVVSETNAGGADVPAPDRTVTTTADSTATTTVLMENLFEPAALVVHKSISGDGAGQAWVPTDFQADVTCSRDLTIGGLLTTVTDFSGLVDVTAGSSASVGDLPKGSRCAVTEPNLHGAQGVTVRSLTQGAAVDGAPGADPDDATVTVALVGADMSGANPVVVPTEVELVNRYDATAVEVVKERVGSQADVAGVGPFQVDMTCSWAPDGAPVQISLGTSGSVALSADNGYKGTVAGLPVGATCSGVEPDPKGATAVEYSLPVTTTGVDSPSYTVTNHFDGATFTVSKATTGVAPDVAYGFSVQCTRIDADGEVSVPVADSTLSLRSGESKTVEVLAGSQCKVVETDDGGATYTTVKTPRGMPPTAWSWPTAPTPASRSPTPSRT